MRSFSLNMHSLTWCTWQQTVGCSNNMRNHYSLKNTLSSNNNDKNTAWSLRSPSHPDGKSMFTTAVCTGMCASISAGLVVWHRSIPCKPVDDCCDTDVFHPCADAELLMVAPLWYNKVECNHPRLWHTYTQLIKKQHQTWYLNRRCYFLLLSLILSIDICHIFDILLPLSNFLWGAISATTIKPEKYVPLICSYFFLII